MIPKLVELLRTTPAAVADPDTRVAIVQADESVPAAVVARATASAKAAGFDRVLFAVKVR